MEMLEYSHYQVRWVDFSFNTLLKFPELLIFYFYLYVVIKIAFIYSMYIHMLCLILCLTFYVPSTRLLMPWEPHINIAKAKRCKVVALTLTGHRSCDTAVMLLSVPFMEKRVLVHFLSAWMMLKYALYTWDQSFSL